MHIKSKDTKLGYNEICTIDISAGLEVGKIILEKADTYSCTKLDLERAFLLVEGSVTYKWQGKSYDEVRKSCFDDNPICLHVPKGEKVYIIANEASEVLFEGVYNDTIFEAKLFEASDCVSEQFGKDVMDNTSLRVVRTIIDDTIAPYSNLVIGEVINLPGRWSSYPAHHHVQPEVYTYKFLPKSGFGFSCEGKDVYKVLDGDSVILEGGNVHPQVAAPGYAMYYIWLIPHSPKRWYKDREFLEEDAWLLEDEPSIWSPNL
jgi:5-deoxy-glucuronate isomerase